MKWIDQAPRSGLVLYDTRKLDNNQAINILVGGTPSSPTMNIILLKVDGKINAFHNKCRHFGVPLNVLPDYSFFSDNLESLVCQVHYARYSPQDGHCQAGDCDGNGLEKIAISLKADKILLG